VGNYGFLDQALQHFIDAIQGVWAPVFQSTGVQILLSIGAIALAVYTIQLLITGDVWQFIVGFAMTILALALLNAIFLTSQTLATLFYQGWIIWAQQVSGLSPNTMTPSGVMHIGLQLANTFWAAAGAASWIRAPISALELAVCTPIIIVAFFVASLILLLAEIQVWALIVGASVLLAFAALPWTWGMFPGWGLSVLSSCVKVFFILAMLAVGLEEAVGWASTMTGASSSIVENASLAVQAMIESLLFLGLIYYIPSLILLC
jgi:TrbL/VirB6 plasmid conjugal transfer protein